ncbi:unnamed protein product [Lymnaea stagnalis]|uniref:AIG1-type G domain-containing protein n=1 Tax=Lymnaea stagnalis TaxID=6523 RepID=A0AAV2HCG7_LYMST
MSGIWSSHFRRRRRTEDPTLARSLMLMGRTGNGGSSTANSIMRKMRFTSAASAVSVTKRTDHDVCEFNNTRLHVLDGPGIDFVSTDDESAMKRWMEEMGKAVGYCPEGVSAFLIVLNINNRFTAVDEHAIGLLKSYFGPKFVKKYGIIVMTGGDTYERMSNGVKFLTWCKEQRGPFKKLLKECDKRIVLFNNATKTGGVEDEQLQELLGLVDAIYVQRRGKRYTNRQFEKTREARDKMHLEEISEEILQELSIVIQKLETCENSRLSDEAKSEECEKLILHMDTLERNKSVHGNGLPITAQLFAVTKRTLLEGISERQRVLATYSEDEKQKVVQADRMKTDELFERRLEKDDTGSVSLLQQQQDLNKHRCDHLCREFWERRNSSLMRLETSLKESVCDLSETYLKAKDVIDELVINGLVERNALPLNDALQCP